MKAIVKENRKQGLTLLELEKPEVKPGNLLVRIRACSICGGDNYLYKWTRIMETWNIPLPIIIGHEFCGDIIAIGDDINGAHLGFRIGDKIAADSHVYCNKCLQCREDRKHNCENLRIFGIHTDGAFAEYANVPSSIAFKIPEGISYEEGALLEPFGVAVKSFHAASSSISERAVVIGGGPIGLFILKLCIISGLKNTYLIEPNKFRQDFARSLGAVNILDPSDQQQIESIAGEFTIAFEVSGTSDGLQNALRLVGPSGKVIIVGAQQDKVAIDIKNDIMQKELTVRGTFGRDIWDTWYEMMGILENSNILLKDFITHRFNFNQLENAFSLSLAGNCGKIILRP